MLLSSGLENFVPIRTSEIRFLSQTCDDVFFCVIVKNNVSGLKGDIRKEFVRKNIKILRVKHAINVTV